MSSVTTYYCFNDATITQENRCGAAIGRRTCGRNGRHIISIRCRYLAALSTSHVIYQWPVSMQRECVSWRPLKLAIIYRLDVIATQAGWGRWRTPQDGDRIESKLGLMPKNRKVRLTVIEVMLAGLGCRSPCYTCCTVVPWLVRWEIIEYKTRRRSIFSRSIGEPWDKRSEQRWILLLLLLSAAAIRAQKSGMQMTNINACNERAI